MKLTKRDEFMYINRWGENIISDRIFKSDVLEIALTGITNPNVEYKIFQNINTDALSYDYYGFEYILDGKGYIETPHNKYVVQKGDLYFLNKLRYHIYYPDKSNPFKKEFVVIRGEFADQLVALYNITNSVIVKHIDVDDVFKKIFNNVETSKQTPDNEMESLILQLFQAIRQPLVKKREANKEFANDIVDYFHTHIQEKMTLAKLSEDFFMSQSSMGHLFSDEFGCAPIKYFIKMKIDYAKTLLVNTNHSVRYIANYLAFDDDKYFSKCFKKETGQTPTQYRKSQKPISLI